MNVWDDTTASNCSLDEGIKLLISSNGELKMSWCDSFHFKILASVSGELENLSSQVLEDSSSIDS